MFPIMGHAGFVSSTVVMSGSVGPIVVFRMHLRPCIQHIARLLSPTTIKPVEVRPPASEMTTRPSNKGLGFRGVKNEGNHTHA